MKNYVFCGKCEWPLVAPLYFLSYREKEIENSQAKILKTAGKGLVWSWRSKQQFYIRFLERIWTASALEGLENTVLLLAIMPLQNNHLHFMFYMLFHGLCQMIRNLPDLHFSKWERNLLKYNMSKLSNISKFYLSGYSADRWSGLQSQTLICMCLHR